MKKTRIIKYCEKCNKQLSKKNKGIHCNHCRDRSGQNNPFFGKRHTDNVLQLLQHKCKHAAQKLWKNTEYRNKVIKNATGLKRSIEFKTEQSQRISEWYKNNPEQLEIRSKALTKTWNQGKIQPNIHSINESKLEKTIKETLEKNLPNHKIEKKTIRIEKKWFLPDIIINDQIIVEFYGSYWHGDPKKYNENDIVHHNFTAKEIWERDKKRVDALVKAGYTVYVIWERDYKEDNEKSLQNLIERMNTNENKSVEIPIS